MKLRTKVVLCAVALLVPLALVPPKVKALVATYVQVVNTLAQWVPTGNVFEPGRNAVQVSLGTSIATSGAPSLLYTVPAGKRLVIQQFSAKCLSSGGVQLGTLVTTVNGNTVYTYIAPDLGHASPAGVLNVFAEHVTAYADASSSVMGAFATTNPPGGSCLETGFAGYLVDLGPPAPPVS